MDNIATWSLRDITDQDIDINRFPVSGVCKTSYKKPPHRRADHYLFIFQTTGKSKVVIDFKQLELTGAVVLCILPGQVHYGVSVDVETKAWFISLHSSAVSEDFKPVFDEHYFHSAPVSLSKGEEDTMNECMELISSIKERRRTLNYVPQVLHNLISACVGMFASACQQMENKDPCLSRKHILTRQFKRLLLQQFRSHQSSVYYAKALSVTAPYLNEAVKKITGFTVTFWIQQATIAEARRLLYATDSTVKEIAYLLGFTDHAYFTRYFSGATGQSPTRFRQGCSK